MSACFRGKVSVGEVGGLGFKRSLGVQALGRDRLVGVSAIGYALLALVKPKSCERSKNAKQHLFLFVLFMFFPRGAPTN